MATMHYRGSDFVKYGFVLSLLVLGGCTTMDVRPIAASAKLDKICIRYNDDVNVDDFVPVMQEDFFNHGITSVVFRAEKPKNCGFTLDYTVDRWWDLAPYMVDAQITVNKDDAFIGSAHYHLTGHGGLSVMKWEGTHSKIDPVLDEMLRNYPKIEMGAAPKTAAN
jgi:hypothetical protein